MNKRLLLTLVLSCCAPLALADGVAQLKAFFNDTQTLRANFTQTVTGRSTQLASGQLELSRPGKFRWTYDQPYQQLIIGDGTRLWMYDVDLAQVTSQRMAQALGSSPAALLAGNNEIERVYTLKDQGMSDGLDWLEATPKTPDSTFKTVRMGFKNGNLYKMIMTDNFSQITLLEFSNLQRNPTLPAADFQFTPPKGVDVLTDRSGK